MEKPCRKGNSLPLACSPLCEVERVDTELRKLMSQHADGAHDGVCMRVSLFYAAPFCAALQGPSAAWLGAGRPRPSLPAAELPPLLMQALQLNDFPEIDAGLHAMWAFVGDSTRFIYKNNETEFIEDAHTTANTLPTSFYGMAMHGREWEMETELTLVGNDLEAAWIATQIMRTVSSDGRMRRWQWELRRHRRPPNLGAWYVESIGSSDVKGNFEIAD